jgi:hypothetical protein
MVLGIDPSCLSSKGAWMNEWAGFGPRHEAEVCHYGGGVGMVNSNSARLCRSKA